MRTVASGAGAVLGTQALLRAIGIGGGAAAAGSASLNWVLKDGLGRLGAILAASLIGDRFDGDPKTFFLLGTAENNRVRDDVITASVFCLPRAHWRQQPQ